MRVLMNFTPVRGPYGGANSFLRTLTRALERRGVAITTRVDGRYDVALLNALTNGLDLETVRRVAERAPVVHRKVGYRASGPPELRAEVDGVIVGDARQVEFTPHVTHTIFQSEYSRDVFLGSGFDGPYTVVRNGVDDALFTPYVRRGVLRRRVPRTFWDGKEPLRLVVSTWSQDPLKGFDDYVAIDRALAGRDDVELCIVGRVPETADLHNATLLSPRPSRRLPPVLRDAHVILQLARWETCSNALLEGLACGLPAVYLDSGSNAELAARYGVEYRGDVFAAVDELRPRYPEIVAELLAEPFRIASVVASYWEILNAVAEAA
jgi:glycosyltransferase involved in cell wall biosynthesis